MDVDYMNNDEDDVNFCSSSILDPFIRSISSLGELAINDCDSIIMSVVPYVFAPFGGSSPNMYQSTKTTNTMKSNDEQLPCERWTTSCTELPRGNFDYGSYQCQSGDKYCGIQVGNQKPNLESVIRTQPNALVRCSDETLSSESVETISIGNETFPTVVPSIHSQQDHLSTSPSFHSMLDESYSDDYIETIMSPKKFPAFASTVGDNWCHDIKDNVVSPKSVDQFINIIIVVNETNKTQKRSFNHLKHRSHDEPVEYTEFASLLRTKKSGVVSSPATTMSNSYHTRTSTVDDNNLNQNNENTMYCTPIWSSSSNSIDKKASETDPTLTLKALNAISCCGAITDSNQDDEIEVEFEEHFFHESHSKDTRDSHTDRYYGDNDEFTINTNNDEYSIDSNTDRSTFDTHNNEYTDRKKMLHLIDNDNRICTSLDNNHEQNLQNVVVIKYIHKEYLNDDPVSVPTEQSFDGSSIEEICLNTSVPSAEDSYSCDNPSHDEEHSMGRIDFYDATPSNEDNFIEMHRSMSELALASKLDYFQSTRFTSLKSNRNSLELLWDIEDVKECSMHREDESVPLSIYNDTNNACTNTACHEQGLNFFTANSISRYDHRPTSSLSCILLSPDSTTTNVDERTAVVSESSDSSDENRSTLSNGLLQLPEFNENHMYSTSTYCTDLEVQEESMIHSNLLVTVVSD